MTEHNPAVQTATHKPQQEKLFCVFRNAGQSLTLDKALGYIRVETMDERSKVDARPALLDRARRRVSELILVLTLTPFPAHAQNNLLPCTATERQETSGDQWETTRIVVEPPTQWIHAVHWWLLYPIRHQQHFFFRSVDRNTQEQIDFGSWLLSSATHKAASDGASYRCFAAKVELDLSGVDDQGFRFRRDNSELAAMAVLVNGFGPCTDEFAKPLPDKACHKTDQMLPWLHPEPHFVTPAGWVYVDMTTRYALKINYMLWTHDKSTEARLLTDLRNYRLVITARRRLFNPTAAPPR